MKPQEPVTGVELSAIQLAWLQEIGLDKRMLARFSAVPPPAPAKPLVAPAASPARNVHHDIPAPAPARSGLVPASRPPVIPTEPAPVVPLVADTLAALAEQAATCERCDLHRERGRVAFGEGVVGAHWLIVGEAPDTFDDREGRPFSGKAGQLLTAMLHAVGVQRETQVYVTQLVKCRPLGNRPPLDEHVRQCADYLTRQIGFVRPAAILALGDLAARSLSGENATVDELRGRLLQFTGVSGQSIPLAVTYHPAALLLRPQLKPQVWRDLLWAREHLAPGAGFWSGAGNQPRPGVA
ncbi:MAG: uracil-DNA glycosylase family protein [Burkholderiaceae bacterium]